MAAAARVWVRGGGCCSKRGQEGSCGRLNMANATALACGPRSRGEAGCTRTRPRPESQSDPRSGTTPTGGVHLAVATTEGRGDGLGQAREWAERAERAGREGETGPWGKRKRRREEDLGWAEKGLGEKKGFAFSRKEQTHSN